MDLQKHARAVSLQQCDAFTKILIVKGLLIVPSKSQALFIRQYPVRGWRDGSELRAIAVLAKDPGVVPSTFEEVHNSL